MFHIHIVFCKRYSQADLLAKQGISAEVINLRSVRPLDVATIVKSVQKTHRCITVEEGLTALFLLVFVLMFVLTFSFFLQAGVSTASAPKLLR